MKRSEFPIEDLAALGLKILQSDSLSERDPGIDPGNFRAGVAVCPKSVSDVCAVVKFCAENGISMVPQGGRTGLAGGTQSQTGQIVVMMDDMKRIREIDETSRIAVVDAGVTLSELEEAVAKFGLTVGIDLASRGSCTIGGMVATNAGGGEAFRNGVMRQRVLGLEAVLPDGSVMSDLKRVIKSNEGYDVKQLLIGSEGTLGILTGIVLKLENAVGPRQTVLAATESAASALNFFNSLRSTFGANLLAAEIMWKDYFETTCGALGFEERLGNLKGETYLIAEVAIDEGDDALLDLFSQGFEAGDVADALVAKNEQERNDFWRVREDTFQVDNCYPGGCWFDISIPLNALDAFVRESTARLHAVDPNLRVFVMGHLGDGNLHYTIAADYPVDHLYQELSEALYSGLHDIGGSFSAEHGVGTEKASSLAKFGDPGRLAMMRAIKQSLDPQNIMNPGKVLCCT